MENKTLPRDVFMHFLSIILLATTAISFGILLFGYIDICWPDNVAYVSKSSISSSIRYAMAVLIIVFPVFVWAQRFLDRDLDKNPEKRSLGVRRWLLYFTLFIASLVIIGDLVAVLFNFLNGELSIRFMMKASSVLLIAGSIFTYYFSQLKDTSNNFSWIGLFNWAVIVLVIAGVLSGFFLIGSPNQQRLVRQDDERINSLSFIQSEIINYWQSKQVLPKSLIDLEDSIRGVSIPKDPESGNAYEFRVLSSNKFELCANFSTSNLGDFENRESQPMYMYDAWGPYWSHDKGRVCFEREIDTDLYPPFDKEKIIEAR